MFTPPNVHTPPSDLHTPPHSHSPTHTHTTPHSLMLPHAFSDTSPPHQSKIPSHHHPLSQYSQPTRFFLSSIIGTIAFLFSYELIYYLIDGDNGEYGSSLAWLITYTLSIWLQHELNQKLVFINGASSILPSDVSSSAPLKDRGTAALSSDYWSQLGRTYLIYMGSMIVSTLLNMTLATLGMPPRSAMLMTLLLTGFGNYFLLNRFMN